MKLRACWELEKLRCYLCYSTRTSNKKLLDSSSEDEDRRQDHNPICTTSKKPSPATPNLYHVQTSQPFHPQPGCRGWIEGGGALDHGTVSPTDRAYVHLLRLADPNQYSMHCLTPFSPFFSVGSRRIGLISAVPWRWVFLLCYQVAFVCQGFQVRCYCSQQRLLAHKYCGSFGRWILPRRLDSSARMGRTYGNARGHRATSSNIVKN